MTKFELERIKRLDNEELLNYLQKVGLVYIYLKEDKWYLRSGREKDYEVTREYIYKDLWNIF